MVKTRKLESWTTSRWITLIPLALFATLVACSPKESTTTTDPAGETSKTKSAAVPPKKLDLDHPVVVVDTSAGAITMRLDAEKCPGTVRNFLNYVNEGFYDNTLVHYVAPGSMIVAGGYSADRTPKPTRPSIRNEAHNGAKNTVGSVAMARDATLIDSATSQFFINLADAPQRDYKGDTAVDYGYCVFGQVTEGLNIAQQIAQSPTTDMGNDLAQTPNPAILIKSIRVIQ